jgi:hypothetical protein
LVVPATQYLWTRVIEEIHNRVVTAYPGRNKMKKLIAPWYWWPGMMADIGTYVSNCMACRSAQHPRDKTPGLLHPIPPLEESW